MKKRTFIQQLDATWQTSAKSRNENPAHPDHADFAFLAHHAYPTMRRLISLVAEACVLLGVVQSGEATGSTHEEIDSLLRRLHGPLTAIRTGDELLKEIIK